MDKVRENFSKEEFPVFGVNEIKSWLVANQGHPAYAHIILHNLESSGEIYRITRGFYTFHEDAHVVGFAFKPFYYGLEDALYMHNIIEQGSNPVVVTTRKVRNGLRNFAGRNYVIHRIENRHFFGFELVGQGKTWLPVSDLEKTFIDLVYFRHYAHDEAMVKLLKTVDRKKVRKYLDNYDKRFANKVMCLLKEK